MRLADIPDTWFDRLANRFGKIPPLFLFVLVLFAPLILIFLPFIAFTWAIKGVFWLLGRLARPLIRTPLGQKTLVALQKERLSWDRWWPCHPGDLLESESLLRKSIIPLAGIGWLALIGLGAASGFVFTFATTLPAGIAGFFLVCFTLMMIAAGFGLVLLGVYRAVVSRWSNLDGQLCPRCGYDRSFEARPRCPECGTTTPPLASRELPPSWQRWDHLMNHAAVCGPVGIFGMCFVPVMAFGKWLPPVAIGIPILLGTAVTIIVIVIVVESSIREGGRS